MTEHSNIDERFPQIEDITVTFEEGALGSSAKKVRILRKHELPPKYLPCSSPVCKGGGIHLEGIFWRELSGMVRNKQTEAIFYETCQGYENMSRGQRRACLVTTVSVN